MKPSGRGRIRVNLKERSYDIWIGCHHLDRLGQEVRRLDLGTHPIVLTNPTILEKHGQARKVCRALFQSGFAPEILTVPDTERSKSLGTLGRLLTRLADLDKPGRRLFLVLVGGGVVGDLGGVAAGLYKRGIPFVQVPTTVLAQVDSAIGGKTAVDLPQGKNLVGLFYQPRLVFIELEFLRSLPERQFRSGLAEAAKCGVIRDAELFRILEEIPPSVLRFSEDKLQQVIGRAVRVKVWTVERDEKEQRGIRTLLNFGHTLGHAIEAAAHYNSRYTHGEAVAIGMCAATEISRRLRLISPSSARRITHLVRHLGLPTAARGVSLSAVLKMMSHDKKWSVGRNRWVLPTGIGRAVVRVGVPERVVRAAVGGVMEG